MKKIATVLFEILMKSAFFKYNCFLYLNNIQAEYKNAKALMCVNTDLNFICVWSDSWSDLIFCLPACLWDFSEREQTRNLNKRLQCALNHGKFVYFLHS